MTKYRRLLLVALDWTRPKDPPLSLGHASILANLKKHSVNVIPQSWSVNDRRFSVHKVVDFAMSHADENTDLAIGAFVWNEQHTQNILSRLKQHKFPGRIILGGPQISYVKKGIEKYYPKGNVFIRGYAEEAMAKLMLANEEYPIIRGVHYAGEPDMGLSANVDFDAIPSPFLTGLIPPQRFIRWETQRGCPFRCSFCQHRESDITMQRKSFPENRLFKEIEWINSNRIVQDIAVLDPTFNSGEKYISILDALSDGKYDGKIALQCRMEMVTPEFLDAVHRLNQTAKVVLEFGLQTINPDEQRIIQRPNNMTKVKQVLKDVYDRNIEIEVSLIFGLPNQTLNSFEQSIAFCKQMNVPTIYAFPLMLLRGTPLFEQKKELQLVESSDIDIPNVDRLFEGIPHVISSPTFTYLEWQKMAELASQLEHYNKREKKVKDGNYHSTRNNAASFFNIKESREDDISTNRSLKLKK